MKKTIYFKRMVSVLLCLMMMAGIFPTSAFAAKEMFMEITRAGVTDIDAPVAGKKGDYTATPVDEGKYTVDNLDYYETATNRLKPSSESFKYDTEYYVLVTLKTKSAYYFAYSGDTGNPLAAVSCNGNAAMAVDLGPQANSTTIGIKAFFPRTEKDPNAGQNTGSGTAAPTTPSSTVVTTVNITLPETPIPGAVINSKATIDNDTRVQIGEVKWFRGSSTTPMSVNERFVYGETYTAQFTINVWSNYEFAKDYTHAMATKDKPWHAVWVYVNGQKATTVMPDYTKSANMAYLTVAMTYKCDSLATIKALNLSDITAPAAGQAPDYTFSLAGSDIGYWHTGRTDAYYKDGVCWSVENGAYLSSTGQAFSPNTRYQVDIRLKPNEGYVFATKANGNIDLTATVNGQTATVSGNKNEVLITCVFPETKTIAFSQAGITDIDAPQAGKSPDYAVTYSNINYGPANYNDSTTVNGISWYNETDKKPLTSKSAFESGKVYSVSVTIWANDGYTFQYKSGAVNVAGTVNGKEAEVSSRSDVEVTLTYTFPKTAAHKCTPLRVDEYKATCKEEGKKSYYYCPECGKSFEDSKCTKEIADVNAWGVIPKTTHTGGKATCDNRAICTICGDHYGELAPHQFTKTWDYKDAIGHAHICKVCGVPDTIQPHGGGTASCGQVAKCAECKAEYGEVMQHQWSSGWTFTDSKGHAHKCTVCGDHDTVQPHTGGTADCQNKAKCTVCNAEYGKTGDHKWSTAWDFTSAAGHAHACTVKGCTAHDDIVKHTPGPAATETTSQNCTVCNYVITAAIKHEHKLTKVNKVDATCTTDGKEQYYVCDGCGKLFSDAKGTKEITDPNSLIIKAAGHKESKWKSDADTHWKECTVKGCEAIIEGTKLGHEFDKNDKCTVCSYKREVGTAEVISPAVPETTAPVSSTDPVDPDTQDTDTQTNPPKDPQQGGDSTTTEPNTNAAMWIIVAAAVAVAAGCMIVMTVVLVKKNKKAE